MRSIILLSQKQLTNWLTAFLLLIIYSSSSFAQSITRTQMINNAIPFATYTFTAAASNLTTGYNCSGIGNIRTPSWVVVGANSSMAYCWGGFSTLSSFTSGLLNGKYAGNNDCTTGGDIFEQCAVGVDCSGFVCRSWGRTTKESTSSLYTISTALGSPTLTQPGDVFNLSGSHVRLVETNYGNGNYRVIESSGNGWNVAYRTYTAAQLSSYTPRKYNSVVTYVPPPPANDNCSGAINLPVNTSCVSTTGDIAGATASGLAKATCDVGSSTKTDVWYKFQATASSQTVAMTPSSGLDAVLSVYTSCTSGLIGCADNGGGPGGIEKIALSGLTVGATYYVRIYNYGSTTPSTTTFNICVTGPGSSSSSCGTPSGLSASAVTSSSATLSWAAVAGATSYNVAYKPASSSTWITVTSSTTSKSITSLSASTSYQFGVQAVCSITGAYSSVSTFTTTASSSLANDNCSGAQTLTSSTSCVSTAGTITGATASGLAKGSCDVGTSTMKDVWYKFQATASTHTITLTPSSGLDAVLVLYTSCTGGQVGCADNGGGPGGVEKIKATGLTVGATYYVRIYNYGSTTPTTNTFNICVTEPNTSACGTPSGLYANNIASSTVTLNWVAVAGATSYNIQYKASSAITWKSATSTTNSKAITGLAASTAHQFQVQAVCANTGAYSSLATFTTSAPSTVNCTKTLLTTIEGFNVYKHVASGAIMYKAKMTIDADGSPRAYGPSNSGLDYTANAGSPGNWWGVVTNSSGNPIIQGPGDPYPGMYVSTTSLVSSAYPSTSPYRYTNSETVPYIAIPSALKSLGGIQTGDISYVYNTATGLGCYATFADVGPSGKLGEGSIYLASQIGVNSNPKTGGVSGGIIYIIFPNSGYGQGTIPTVTQINAIGTTQMNNIGGVGILNCTPWLKPNDGDDVVADSYTKQINNIPSEPSEDFDFSIYPVPSDGEMIFGKMNAVIADNQSILVRIYDLFGRELISKSIPVENGVFSLPVTEANLSQGMYVMTGTINEKQYTKRILIK